VLDDLGAAAARVEIERCRDLIDRLTGSPGAHVRQSGGAHPTALVLRHGRRGRVSGLSVLRRRLAVTGTDPGPAAVRRTVAARAQPGSVVSMHFGHPGTLTALPGVLAEPGPARPAFRWTANYAADPVTASACAGRCG